MTLLKKTRLIVFALTIVVICIIFSFYFFEKSSTVHTFSQSHSNSVDTRDVIKSEPSSNTINAQINAENKKDIKENEMSQTDWKIFKSWADQHGYPDKDDLKSYESYSRDILNDLAARGDLLALRVLTNESINKGDRETALKYIRKSAVHGSTAALETMTILTAPGYKDKTDEQRRLALLETFSVTQVMKLRGNKSLSQMVDRELIMSYGSNHGRASLTTEEKLYVDKRARELYDELQQERYKLGLGDFDNDEPFSMKKFFGLD